MKESHSKSTKSSPCACPQISYVSGFPSDDVLGAQYNRYRGNHRDMLLGHNTKRRDRSFPLRRSFLLSVFSFGNETAVGEVDGKWRGQTGTDDAVAPGELIWHRGSSPHPDFRSSIASPRLAKITQGNCFKCR